MAIYLFYYTYIIHTFMYLLSWFIVFVANLVVSCCIFVAYIGIFLNCALRLFCQSVIQLAGTVIHTLLTSSKHVCSGGKNNHRYVQIQFSF